MFVLNLAAAGGSFVATCCSKTTVSLSIRIPLKKSTRSAVCIMACCGRIISGISTINCLESCKTVGSCFCTSIRPLAAQVPTGLHNDRVSISTLRTGQRSFCLCNFTKKRKMPSDPITDFLWKSAFVIANKKEICFTRKSAV